MMECWGGASGYRRSFRKEQREGSVNAGAPAQSDKHSTLPTSSCGL
ncbi:hypothetical protein M3J09_007554 [Ascochyta lentis]